MKNNKNYYSVFRRSALATLLCGFGYVSYQIKRSLEILNNTVDLNSLLEFELFRTKTDINDDSNYISIEWNKPEKSSSYYERFWDSITFSYARRLLSLAQSDNREMRVRAVRSLSRIESLDDWHCSLLAHTCDARTAVGLARNKEADPRLFTGPPSVHVIHSEAGLVRWTSSLLKNLENRCSHPCLAYFLRTRFADMEEAGLLVEHDLDPADVARYARYAHELLPECVNTLLHHCSLERHARDLALLGGLPLLMELYRTFKEDPEMVVSLVSIIAIVSAYRDLLHQLFNSGWIGVLSHLLKSDDIRISGPAAKALANLDSDDHFERPYEKNVYLLYPVFRTIEKPEVDVILVHGLLGGVFFTWRQRDAETEKNDCYSETKPVVKASTDVSKIALSSDPSTREYIQEIEERQKSEWNDLGKDYEIVFHDLPLTLSEDDSYSCSGESICPVNGFGNTQCWPKDWLPTDCSNLRILGINYDTNLSLWSPMCPMEKILNNTLATRSIDFLEKLANVGVGKRPIIWLTHSMGGLLVKNMLTQAWESKNEHVKNICANTKGVVFFSTPHRGSHVASLNQTTSLFLWPSVEVQELKEGSPALLALHDKFLDLLHKVDIQVLSFAETQSTSISPLKFNIQFVRNHSAFIDMGQYYEIGLDHLCICKPVNRHSFLYQKVLAFIRDIKEQKTI